MPDETVLAAQFGVAPVTLREALSILRSQGKIETRRGRHGGALSAPDPLQPKKSCARLRGITTLELRDYADERERLFDRDQASFYWQHYILFIERKSCALRTHNKRVRF